MSKEFDAHQHLKHIPPGTQFDDSEPRSGRIFIAAIISVVSVIVTITGVYTYYSWYRSKVLFERQLSPASVELKAIRSVEDQTLNTYGYVDKDKVIVRLPIARAMDFVAGESAEGKEKYPVLAKPLPKPEDLAAAAAVPAPGTVAVPAAAIPVAPVLPAKEKH